MALGFLALLVARQAALDVAVQTKKADAALSLYPEAASARALAAEAALVSGDDRAAASHARASLDEAPMQATGLRVLALALAQLNDSAGGAAALKLGAALGWRDTPIQLLLLVDALNRQDLTTAVQRADALARRDSQRPIAFAALRGISTLAGGVDLVAERLALRPNYRAGFLAEVSPLKPTDYEAREALLARLAGSGPLAEPDYIDFIHLLVARRDNARAHADWIRWRGTRARGDLLLQDPDFALASGDESGFGWRTASLDGADAVPGTHMLNVWTNGAGIGTLARQTVLLSPGVHLFRVDMIGASDQARDAFRWRISCASSVTIGSLELQPVARSGDRTTLQARFEVPAGNGCDTQVLELDARRPESAAETRASFARASLS